MSNENDSGSGKACAIVLSVILVVILFFPMMATVTDGGSFYIFSPLRIYEIKKCHEVHASIADIDGVSYSYSPFPSSYRVGYEVKIFGFVVFDNTYFDPPLETRLKYQEDIEDIVMYYNRHRVDNVELKGISVSERFDDRKGISLSFSEADNLETSDRILKVMKKYLEDNPESFLYDGFQVWIGSRHDERIEGARGSVTIKTYEANYVIELPDVSVTELRLSGNMIPDSVPSGYAFEDVRRVKVIFNDSIDESQEQVLRSIYPNAEIEQ